MIKPLSEGRWVPFLVVSILGMSVIANIYLVHAATSDQGYVNEPDYYREAMAWDSHMADVRTSAELGWQARATLRAEGEGKALLTVGVVDKASQPLPDVQLHVVASPNLCPMQRIDMDAMVDKDIEITNACPGLWRIDIRATRGSERFIQRLSAELVEAPLAAPGPSTAPSAGVGASQ